ncbi:ead/Ea22-like family protein [Escherichia coli]|uniref:ead/Ea22-like family protein n=1 Tax=Escherichia coli TaxID=562 RepID=UPI001E1768AA|nr:ead/Ea22-like family protein [Escherichia coli]EJF8353754.1 ead/Ea22-like family protein [Escherichia coli]MCX1923216.1 ead/Ea22-like family protein [Escherichia coli]MCX1937445.1 ead/Ea22-like family protein [Escherichia coli]HCN7216113.1 ead/Ea22-like family protein [Escherichia coli]
MTIDYQELREAAEQATQDEWVAYILPGHNGIYPARTSEGRHCGYFIDWPGIDGQRNAGANARYIAAIPPKVALALLDEINALEETRINDVCRIAELTKQLESAKSKLNEQREYYEGVISDGSKRIAELEAREIKPAKGEVLVVVSGFTGCGKSAIAGEIEIAMQAIGVPVQWINGDAEKRMTGADWLTAIEMYKPTVRIVEVNVPRAPGIRIKGDAGEQNDEKP